MEQARTEAKARGEKLYEGRECIHGHGKTRYVSTGGCLECGRKSALDAYHKRRDRMLAVEPQVVTALPESFDENTTVVAGFVVERFAEE